MKILVKSGKKCYKADFFQNRNVTSYILTYQKPKKILLELILELTFEVRATLGCLQISQIAAIVQTEGAGIHQNCSVSDKSIKLGTNVYWTMLIIFRSGVKKNSSPFSNGCYGHYFPIVTDNFINFCHTK